MIVSDWWHDLLGVLQLRRRLDQSRAHRPRCVIDDPGTDSERSTGLEQSLTPGISKVTRRTSRGGSRTRRHSWHLDLTTDPANVQAAVAIREGAAAR